MDKRLTAQHAAHEFTADRTERTRDLDPNWERNRLPQKQGNTPGKPGSLTNTEQRPQFKSGRISAPLAVDESGAAAVLGRVAWRSARGGGAGGRPVAGATLRRQRRWQRENSEARAGEVGRRRRGRRMGRGRRLLPVKYGSSCGEASGRAGAAGRREGPREREEQWGGGTVVAWCWWVRRLLWVYPSRGGF